MTTAMILELVAVERVRQERLREEGKFKWSCAATFIDHEYARASANANAKKLSVLNEEVGEVAREINDGVAGDVNGGFSDARIARIREELIQVAACAVAWAESL